MENYLEEKKEFSAAADRRVEYQMKDKSEFRPLCRTDFAAANKLNFPPTICIPFQHYIFSTTQQDDFSPQNFHIFCRCIFLLPAKISFFCRALISWRGRMQVLDHKARPPFARRASFRITSHASFSTETAQDTNTNINTSSSTNTSA